MPKCRQQKLSTGVSESFGRKLIHCIDKNKQCSMYAKNKVTLFSMHCLVFSTQGRGWLGAANVLGNFQCRSLLCFQKVRVGSCFSSNTSPFLFFLSGRHLDRD